MALAMGHKPGNGALDDRARSELLTRVEGALHRPPMVLDLSAEHDQSMVVLRNLRLVVRGMFGTALDIARELYPDDWRHLTPRLLSLASWVGYDTDGRSDIIWTTTYSKRLRVQLDQLRHYRTVVGKLLDTARGEVALAPLLELLEARLDLAIKSGEDDLELFGARRPTIASGRDGWPRPHATWLRIGEPGSRTRTSCRIWWSALGRHAGRRAGP